MSEKRTQRKRRQRESVCAGPVPVAAVSKVRLEIDRVKNADKRPHTSVRRVCVVLAMNKWRGEVTRDDTTPHEVRRTRRRMAVECWMACSPRAPRVDPFICTACDVSGGRCAARSLRLLNARSVTPTSWCTVQCVCQEERIWRVVVQGWQPVLATKANVASYQVVSSLEGSSRLEGANAV